MDYYAALAALDWHIELGADEAICDAPVNRYELPKAAPKPKSPETGSGSNIAPLGDMPVIPQIQEAGADIARIMAAKCNDLVALRDAMAVFDHCSLKKGARNLVFCDGLPTARLMIIGEAPGRDEDRIGKPFVGKSGQLLDKMCAAIGLSRGAEAEKGVYITNVMPWRPPSNRDPEPEEIDMMLPFLERHIALADPEVIICVGNIACQAVLGKRGITRLRGQWGTAFGKPVMPMFHPAALLRDPLKKRDSWADLLAVQARLKGH